MPNISTLTIRISANSAKLVSEFRRTEKQAKTFSEKVRGNIAVIGSAFAKAGLAGAGAFAYITKESLKNADAMLKMTQRIGGSVEGLSELEHVAQLSGVQFNTLTMGLQRMTRRVAEAAQGTGEAKGALKELGLSASHLVGMTLEDRFETIADALSRVAGESDRTRLAMKLFDSEGVALLQTMTGGAAGIRSMREEARALGKTLSTDQAKAAAAANDALTRLQATVGSLGRDFALSLAPGIQAAADSLRDLATTSTQEEIRRLQITIGTLMLDVKSGSKEGRQEIEGLQLQIEILEGRLKKAAAAALTFNVNSKGHADVAAAFAKTNAELEQIFENQTKVDKVIKEFRARKAMVKAHEDVKAAIEATNDELDEFLELQDRITRNRGDIALSRLKREHEEVHDTIKKTNDEFDELIRGQRESESAAKSLGLTFASAFEDAIVEGRELREVLQGLYRDILRIVVRKTIIEPIADIIVGGIKGKTPAPGGGTTPTPTPGPSEKLFAPITSKSEKSGGFTFIQNVDAKGATHDVIRALPSILARERAAAIADFRDIVRRGTV